MRAVGRHRARRDAADVGMVGARRGEEEQAAVVEDRHHHRDVGQVRAAIIGVVEGVDVALAHLLAAQLQDGAHRFAHRAQMDGHVRGVGDQVAVGIEDGAGEVEPLLDVDRVGGVLERDAHLLGDGHEQIVEDLEQDRVGLGAQRGALGQRLDALQEQVVVDAHLERPAGLDHDRGGLAADQRRAGDPVAGQQRLAPVDPGHNLLRRLVRRPVGEHGRVAHGLQRRRALAPAVARAPAPPPCRRYPRP